MDLAPQDLRLEDRLIVALDMDEVPALALAQALLPRVSTFKVGLQLTAASGAGVVERLGRLGAKVFLDLKMLDIPETVTRALREIQSRHPHVVYATVHAFSRGLGPALRARPAGSALRVLAVTLLTSMDAADLQALGIAKAPLDFVLDQTQRALDEGCDGVIASGQEAAALRARFPGLLIVTPGIRPAWSAVPGEDQKRITTPRQAILSGADAIVVGRPIYQNPPGNDPAEAARRILEEIAGALAERGRNPG
jgi:orotidine-5'-phosphate decarboxylase